MSINIIRQPSRFKQSTKFSKDKKYQQYIGNKFAECTVMGFPGYIDRADIETSKVPAVLVKCSCEKYFITNWYHLKNARVLSCGHVNSNYKSDPTEAACNDLLNRYKHSAKVRKLNFELSYEEFREITSSNCFYCGVVPSQVRNCKGCQDNYSYNGIDRIDSSLGYVVSNVVPCCGICNRAKSDLKQEDFIQYLDRIVQFAALKSSGKNGEG